MTCDPYFVHQNVQQSKQSKIKGFLCKLKRPNIHKVFKRTNAKKWNAALAMKHNDSLEFLTDSVYLESTETESRYREGMDIDELFRASNSAILYDISHHEHKKQTMLRRSSKSLNKLSRKASSSRSMMIDSKFNDDIETRGYVNKSEMKNAVWDDQK